MIWSFYSILKQVFLIWGACSIFWCSLYYDIFFVRLFEIVMDIIICHFTASFTCADPQVRSGQICFTSTECDRCINWRYRGRSCRWSCTRTWKSGCQFTELKLTSTFQLSLHINQNNGGGGSLFSDASTQSLIKSLWYVHHSFNYFPVIP